MSERNLYEVTGDIKDINTLLIPRKDWNTWQPIKTAPRQIKAEYLVYTPGAMYPYDVCRNMNGFRIISNTFDFDRSEQPTMWMPITPAIEVLK